MPEGFLASDGTHDTPERHPPPTGAHIAPDSPHTAEKPPDVGEDVRVAECDADGCFKLSRGKSGGLCRACQKRKRLGRPIGAAGARVMIRGAKCLLEGCEEVQYAKGWCNLHWSRVMRDGVPGPVGYVQVRNVRPKVRMWERPALERTCVVGDCGDVPDSGIRCERHRSILKFRVREALKRAAGLTPDEWDRVEAWSEVLLGDPCPYCGASSTTIDHVQPVSRGGAWTEENIVGACKSCNSAKRDTPLLTFLLRRTA